LFNAIKCNNGIEFPITLGREFAGTVERRGMNIRSSEFDYGDKVWGVVPFHQQGAHAEYVKVDKSLVSKKPKNLEDIEAATILYAGLTAFSGIFVSAPFDGYSAALFGKSSGKGKKVLVLGASGGVGHLAVQILKAEGADVIATCSENAKPLVESLGLSKIIDYSSPECNTQIMAESPFDLILDCAGLGADYANELRWKFKNYVTFKSPLLKNWDENGLIFGGLESMRSIISSNIPVLSSGAGAIKWGYFMPLPNGIQYLKDLVESGKLRPIIDSKFNYTELPQAYERVASGHIRGKVAVQY
jgi:reticulon-4-interacting protein 1, mitochondrial